MAYRVTIGPSALEDVDGIVSYLSGDLGSPQAAQAFRGRLDQIVALLADMPDAFPPVDDRYLRHRGYRKALAGNHVVVYRVVELGATYVGGELDDDGTKRGVVAIMRVFHGLQQWEDLL